MNIRYEEKLILQNFNNAESKLKDVKTRLGGMDESEYCKTAFWKRIQNLNKLQKILNKNDAKRFLRFVHDKKDEKTLNWLRTTPINVQTRENLKKLELTAKNMSLKEDVDQLKDMLTDFKERSGKTLKKGINDIKQGKFLRVVVSELKKGIETSPLKRKELEKVGKRLDEHLNKKYHNLYNASKKSDEFFSEKEKIIRILKKEREELLKFNKDLEALKSMLSKSTAIQTHSTTLKHAVEHIKEEIFELEKAMDNEKKHHESTDKTMESIQKEWDSLIIKKKR